MSIVAVGKEGCQLHQPPDAHATTAHCSKLPGTRFIRAALKIVALGEFSWNKTVSRKFSTVRSK
jgi:hypothetical protein